ncbi:MAG: DUF362 domain-containing protein [Promethearchaeota archaeon]|nr:MAG: DUF362 domain-containing protein [Candidatus Lokiarchaeota archaeon]
MPHERSEVYIGKISERDNNFFGEISMGLSFFNDYLLSLKRESETIIIKPNILPTEFRNNGLPVTNPKICAVVAEYLLSIGFKKIILAEGTTNNRKGEADSLEAMQNNGFMEYVHLWVPFDMNTDKVDQWFEIYSPGDEGNPDDPFDIELGISKLACTYPIISCAKFKTHDVLGLTLSVKNLMGCLSKARRKSTGEILHEGPLVKAYMHGYGPRNPYYLPSIELNYGPSKTALAININRMARNIYPAFSLIDAAPAMEGKGPIRGTEKELNLFLCSNDSATLDAVCCNIVGINLEDNQYIKNLGRMGLGIADPEKARLINLQNLSHLFDEEKFCFHEWYQYCKFTPQEIALLKKYTL